MLGLLNLIQVKSDFCPKTLSYKWHITLGRPSTICFLVGVQSGRILKPMIYVLLLSANEQGFSSWLCVMAFVGAVYKGSLVI